MKILSSQNDSEFSYDSENSSDTTKSLVRFEIKANIKVPENLRPSTEIILAKQAGLIKRLQEQNERFEQAEYSSDSGDHTQEVSSDEGASQTKISSEKKEASDENSSGEEIKPNEKILEAVKSLIKTNYDNAFQITAYHPNARFLQLVARYNIDENQRYNVNLKVDMKNNYITKELRQEIKANRIDNDTNEDYARLPWRIDATSEASPFYDHPSNGVHERDEEKVTMYDEPELFDVKKLDSNTGREIFAKDKVKFLTFLVLEGKSFACIEWTRVAKPAFADDKKWASISQEPKDNNAVIYSYNLNSVKINNVLEELPDWVKAVLQSDADQRHFNLDDNLNKGANPIDLSTNSAASLEEAGNEQLLELTIQSARHEKDMEQVSDDDELIYIHKDKGVKEASDLPEELAKPLSEGNTDVEDQFDTAQQVDQQASEKNSKSSTWIKKPGTGLRNVFCCFKKSKRANIEKTKNNPTMK